MKKVLNSVFLFFICTLITSCGFDINGEDECVTYYDSFVQTPIVCDIKEWENFSPKFEHPLPFDNFGKIYFYENKLFVNDLMRGIHVYDIANLSSPLNLGFLKIPGNIDLSVSCNTLFADSYSDVLSIDISDLENPKLIGRQESVFTGGFYIDQDSTTIVGLLRKDTVYSYNCQNECFSCDILTTQESAGSSSKASNGGLGGSLARFSIHNNHLYTVDAHNLTTYLLENCNELSLQGQENLGWGIETIYGFEDYLFIGSNLGMKVFGGDANKPHQISEFNHEFACDPVYPTKNRAYVTLRSGSVCWNSPNELDVLDIEDIKNPKLIKAYAIPSPYGLSVNNNIMYLCHGENGLSIYDIHDDFKIIDNQLASISNINALDVISLGDAIIVTGKDKVYIYGVSDPTSPQLLSTIEK